MLRFMRSFIVGCLLVGAVLASTPRVGDRAPVFSLPAADGKTISLKDYAGKKLVLVFYRGYW